MNKPNISVLISGRGSNLLSLIKNQINYKVNCIISDNVKAGGLAYGKEFNIYTKAVLKESCSSLKQQKKIIFEAVKESKPDFVVLAGFMQIIPDYFVQEFYGRLINIHPSLLPKLKGLNTHQRAIEANEELHGASVHFVDNELDNGPVIAQVTCPIEENDNSEILADRLLPLEHKLYPWVLNYLVIGDIALKNKKVVYSEKVIQDAVQNNYILNLNR